MAHENIIQKLQKLRVMAERGTEHEADNAKRLFDKLIDEYDIDQNELQEKRIREIKYRLEMKKLVIYITRSFNIPAFYYNRSVNRLFTDCTDQEFDILIQAIKTIDGIYEAQKRVYMRRLNGYMFGYVSKVFPVDNKPVLCPKCEDEMIYKSNCYQCLKCGYKSKKRKSWDLDSVSMMQGQKDSGRLIS